MYWWTPSKRFLNWGITRQGEKINDQTSMDSNFHSGTHGFKFHSRICTDDLIAFNELINPPLIHD